MTISILQPYSFCRPGQRANQEDSRYPDMDIPSPECRMFAVCDGVGGEELGEVASRTVCEAIGNFNDSFRGGEFTVSDFQKLYGEAFSSLLTAASRYGQNRMATTLVFLSLGNNGAIMAHVGDSRIYHIRPGYGILYKSRDHSLVNALIKSGNITPEEAINHPQSHCITKCLTPPERKGDFPSASVFHTKDIEPGDMFLLCSDGVTNCISDAELTEILGAQGSAGDKMKVIGDKCRNSDDNNTAILVPVGDVVKGEEELPETDIDTDDCVTVKIGASSHPFPEVLEVRPQIEATSGNKFMDFLRRFF